MNTMEIKFSRLLNTAGIEYKTRFNVRYARKDKVDIKTFAFYLPSINLLVDVNPTLKHTTYSAGKFHRTVSSSKEYHYSRMQFAMDTGHLYMAIWQWDDMEVILEQIQLYIAGKVDKNWLNIHGYFWADEYDRENTIYIDASKYLVNIPHRILGHSDIRLIWGIRKKGCINCYWDSYICMNGMFEKEFCHENPKDTIWEGMIAEGYLPVYDCGRIKVRLFHLE